MLPSLRPILKNLENLLSCHHCHKVMTDPHLILHCQHHFCGNCMEDCLNESVCLVCRKPVIPRDFHSPPFLQTTSALLSRFQAALDLPPSPLESKQGGFGVTSGKLEGMEAGIGEENRGGEAKGKYLPEWDESETLDPTTRNQDEDFGLSKRASQPEDESMQQRDMSLSPELVRRGAAPLQGNLDLAGEEEGRSFSLGSKKDSDGSIWQGQQPRSSGGVEEEHQASESRQESALPIFTSSESSENLKTTMTTTTTTMPIASISRPLSPGRTSREKESSQSESSPTITEVWSVTTLRNRRQTKSSIVVYQRAPEGPVAKPDPPSKLRNSDLDFSPSKSLEKEKDKEKSAPKSSEKRKREEVEPSKEKPNEEEKEEDKVTTTDSNSARVKTTRNSKKLKAEPREQVEEKTAEAEIKEEEIKTTEAEIKTEVRKTPNRKSRQAGKPEGASPKQDTKSKDPEIARLKTPDVEVAPKERDVFDFTFSQFPEPADHLPKTVARKSLSLMRKKAPPMNQPIPPPQNSDGSTDEPTVVETKDPAEPSHQNHPKVSPAKVSKVTFAPGLKNAPERETKKNPRRARNQEADAKMWGCTFCTFQNLEALTKCHICGKSRKRPLEPPVESNQLNPLLLPPSDQKSDDDFEPENPKPAKGVKRTTPPAPLPQEPPSRNKRAKPPVPIPAEKTPTEKKTRSSPKAVEKPGKLEETVKLEKPEKFEKPEKLEEAVKKEDFEKTDPVKPKKMEKTVQQPEPGNVKRASKEKKIATVVIVHSGLSEKEKAEIGDVVDKIDPKASILEDQEDPRITHVITSADDQGKCKRTMKYLCGIVRGLWVVSYEWLRSSAQKGHWVDETPFEIKGDSVFGLGEAPEKGRVRLEQGKEPLFAGLSFFFQGVHSRPPKSDLELLIRGGGGKVLTAQPKGGGKAGNKSVVVLFDPSNTNPKSAPLVALTKTLTTKESSWIMNSISQYRCNFDV